MICQNIFSTPNALPEKSIQERAKIIALNSSKIVKTVIAWFVNKSVQTVSRWILRFSQTNELSDKKRSGHPIIFEEDIKLKIIAFYLQKGSIPGCNSKSYSWAEVYLNQNLQILGRKVSRACIYRAVTSHGLKPHRNKYFLNITDPDIFPKMENIIKLYMHKPEYLFNYDECTGLQAIGALYPDLPEKCNTPKYQEFDYSRNGRIDLMAFFNANTGEVFGDCFTNHKTDIFVSLFKKHVQMFPEVSKLHYIMDNLSTHFTDAFCQAVAELSGVSYSPLKSGSERRIWLGDDKKRIVIHFTPFHGSWLNLIEIWFGIFNQKCLKQKRFNDVFSLSTHILNFINTWNKHYAHPFTWNYTGEGLHEDIVKRFNTVLCTESDQVQINFLIKQLQLISNIYNSFPAIHNTDIWKNFLNLFMSKREYIQNIITTSEKPKQMKKANEVLQKLIEDLNCQFCYQDL